MNSKLEDFSQEAIAILRLIYMAPGLDSRAYAFKALLRPLVDAQLIAYTTTSPKQSYGPVQLTDHGKDFLRKYKLDHFGYEARHAEQYSAQLANNVALMALMSKFTGRYES